MPYVEDYLEEEEMIDIGEEDDDFDEDVLEMLEEDDDWEEEWDDEEALAESLAERRRRYPKYRHRRDKRYRPRYSRSRSVRGARGATVRTPAGTARVRFPKPMATQASVNRIVKDLKKDIKRNGAAIRKLGKTLDKNTATLDKKINGINADMKKGAQQMQQMMLLPMLLTKPPDLETIKFENGNTLLTTGVDLPVESQKYKAQDTMTMLLPLMMMSGGLGGTSGDSSNMNMMMMMALVLSQTGTSS